MLNDFSGESLAIPPDAFSSMLPVTTRQVGEEEAFTSDARQLHAFLGVRAVFANWIKDRIEQYGLLENKDFVSYFPNGKKGRPSKEYALTLDTAKQLCMVENNEKGRQARRYFIECEKKLRELLSRQSVLPYHIQRYQVNRLKIPGTHFSMLEQMNLKLLASLEAHNYIVPARMMPDIALGRMFSAWLRASGFDPDSFPTYQHEFLDGVRPIVEARLYPLQLLLAFNEKLDDWIQSGKALTYFAERDKAAIEPIKAVRNEFAALSAAYSVKLSAPIRRRLT